MRNGIIGILLFIFCFFAKMGMAQQGKDGAFTTATSTVVNVYTTLTSNAVPGNTTLSVASTAGIAAGDLVYVIQMQGAVLNAYRDTSNLLDPTNSYTINTGLPYGKVLNIGSCGHNEFAQVSAISGTTITLDCGLKYSYDVSGHVQVIRVPRYSSLTINSGGNITCPQWNGSTGGVVVIEVQGNTTINTGGKMDASGLGFRGGAIHNCPSGFGVTNAGTAHWEYGGWKGEGVGGDTAYYRSKMVGDFGMGAMGNAGGAGVENNSGGGGGANAGNFTTYPWTGKGVPDASMAGYVTAWNLEGGSFAASHSSGGGRGGYSFSSSNQNPQTLAPGNGSWSGDGRRNIGGMGGEPMDYSTGRVFLGGGGGAGDENDFYAGAGGNGGGIINLVSYGTVSGGGQILVNGADGSNTNAPSPSLGNYTGVDGAGGGGGGGAILVNSTGAITLTNAAPVSAAGGKGGTVNEKCNGVTRHDAYGPGGGGGGGYVGMTNSVISNVLGGNNGIMTGSGSFYSSNIATSFPPNGATKGDTGIKATITNFYLTVTNYTVCAGSSASLTVTANGTGIPNPISYNWYSAQTGGNPIFTGNPYSTGALSVGTYTYYAGTCPGTYRIPVVVTVLSAPTVSVTATPTAVCAAQSSTLTATGASTYTWSSNAGSATTPSVVVTPTVVTTYSVTGANGTCTNTQTVSVAITSAPTLTATATPTAICAGQTATLTANGATSYTWSANAGGVLTATTVVTPTVNTTYTVTGANGSCTSTQTVSVAMTSAPTLTVTATPTAVCAGQTATLTASGATSYTWSANAGGAVSPTAVVTPTVNTTYTVTSGNGSCTSTQTVSVAITSAPTLTVTATPTAVCAGQTTTLTASGATSYTWSANAGGAVSPTAVVTPTVNTTYTVTGGNAGCTSTQTISVNLNSPPTLTVTANPTAVCPGASSTLTAVGASSYTWSANAGGVNTATAVVTATVNTTYTVTGDNSGCVSTGTVAVAISAPPTLTITATPAAICNGASSVLSALGASSYTWSANAGGSNTATITVTPSVTTSYTLTGDNGGCISTQIVSVVVNQGPTAADSAFVSAACGQANGSYSLNSVTGGTPSFQINFNNIGFASISSFPYTVSNLSAAVYPIVIQDNNGCTYATSITINNSGGITKVDSTIGNAVCNPNNSGYIVLTSVTGGTGPYEVNVNGGGFTPIAAFPDSMKNLIAGSYTVTVKDASGCLHTSVISVGSIGGITQVNTTQQSAVCVPANSGNIVLSSVTGGTGPYQYSVNGGALNNISAFPDSIKNLTSGSYTVVVQDAAGCTNTSAINVGGPNTPTSASSSTANDTCNRSVGMLNVLGVTGGTPSYQYSINGGTLQSSTSFSGLAAGIYTVTVQDNNGCMYVYTDTVGLTTIPSPTVTPQGSTNFCQGGSVVLSSSSASGNTWSTTATTQTVSVDTSGFYWVSVTQNGCTVTSNTVPVTVNPNPTVTVNSPTVCSGSSTVLSATVVPVGGIINYTWSPAAGLSSTSGASVTANPTTTTPYTVSVSDGNNCQGMTTTTVVVNLTPAALANDSFLYCLYQTAPQLTAIPTSGATVNWYDNNMNLLSGPPIPPTNILGITTYYASQTLGNCESIPTPMVITVIPGPSAAFVTDPITGNILPTQTVTFTPSQPYPYYIFNWDFNDASSGSNNTSSQMTPTHAYATAGIYCPQLLVTSLQTTCKDSFTICLDVINGVTVTIPNVFSPNGDNINEVFSVKTEGVRELSCIIFDRWGLKMYAWDGTTGYWDGTTSGKQCSDGTYFYVVNTTDVKGTAKTYKGYVQLIR